MDPTWRIQDITTKQVTPLSLEKTANAHFGSSGRKGGALGLRVVQLPKRRVSFIELDSSLQFSKPTKANIGGT